VKHALVAQNVAPDRVMTRAFGEAFPVASNATPAGRQLNRRVEFVIPRTEVAGLTR
jgi:outer membrane protein OmpA-like peptidoglycan-associated protein